MSDSKQNRPINSLGKRIKSARKNAQELSQDKKDKKIASGSTLGLALRISLELISAIIIGIVIGWLLDKWLDTKPWLMIVLFFLGAAAGILNVFRMANDFGYTVGYKKNSKKQVKKYRN